MGKRTNALYTYLLIPFIKLLGLTEFATRLPMAIISCTSLIVIYCLFKEVYNKKMGVIAAAFLAICPWHIMKSRYGLENNIIINFIYSIIHTKKKAKIYLHCFCNTWNICVYVWNFLFFLAVFCNSTFNLFNI